MPRDCPGRSSQKAAGCRLPSDPVKAALTSFHLASRRQVPHQLHKGKLDVPSKENGRRHRHRGGPACAPAGCAAARASQRERKRAKALRPKHRQLPALLAEARLQHGGILLPPGQVVQQLAQVHQIIPLALAGARIHLNQVAPSSRIPLSIAKRKQGLLKEDEEICIANGFVSNPKRFPHHVLEFFPVLSTLEEKRSRHPLAASKCQCKLGTSVPDLSRSQ